eukprot:COSAG01_NODE_9657_length_2378_cov_2.215007_2_plen_252_part_00
MRRVLVLLAHLVVQLLSYGTENVVTAKGGKKSRATTKRVQRQQQFSSTHRVVPPSSSRMDLSDYQLGKSLLPVESLPRLTPQQVRWRNYRGSDESAEKALSKRLFRDGHVHIGQVLSADEIRMYRPHILRSALQQAHDCEANCDSGDDPLDERCRGCDRTRQTPKSMPKSFIKARNLHRHDAGAAKLVLSSRLAALAASALGTQADVRLYQDAAFLKEPGDMESSWHQDATAAPMEADRMVTVSNLCYTHQ